MTAPNFTAHIPRGAANVLLAAFSVAHVASGYARSLRPGEKRFSRPGNAICSGGDR
jgi:hypothetical protein